MKKEEILSFDEFCIETIRTRLEEMEGFVTSGGDLAFFICEPMVANGTFNHDYSLDEQYINEWGSDCSSFYDWYENEYDTAPANPFSEPNRFLVEMVSEAIEKILSQSKTVTKVWNEEFEITEEFSQQLIKEITENEYESGF